MSVLAREYRIASLLIDLEASLRMSGLWAQQPPSGQALASPEPFCVDTLEFPQWLQFVFLPRMSALIGAGSPLPSRSGIAEMAEFCFAGKHAAMVALLREIDRVIGEGETGPDPGDPAP